MITRYESAPLPNEMVAKYLSTLVNKFFKILPMKENNEPSLPQFMSSLQVELIGFQSLISSIGNDALYINLLIILEYLINNECSTATVKREVFKAILLCKKLKSKYFANKEEA